VQQDLVRSARDRVHLVGALTRRPASGGDSRRRQCRRRRAAAPAHDDRDEGRGYDESRSRPSAEAYMTVVYSHPDVTGLPIMPARPWVSPVTTVWTNRWEEDQ